IHAENDEVAIVENASMAWGLAFNGIEFQKGEVIITSEMEYVTNLLGFINAEQTQGIQVKVIPNDEEGNFSLQALEEAITPETRLIAITHIASTAGTVLPVAEIGKIARKHNILYLVDACQTVGQIPINVKEIGCDILSATGRKYLRAPRGTGFLYVRKEVQDTLKILFMDGHTAQLINENSFEIRKDARRFELFEKNRALTMGLGRAIEYALEIGVGRIWQRIQFLAGVMRRQMSEIDGITVHDNGYQKSGIVTFTVDGVGSSHVRAALSEKKIHVSVGLAKSTLIYMNRKSLTTVVRASIHYYNTEEEINRICEALESIVKSAARLQPAGR
ncbi:MAG TPA: aminotransferase class V-fold PLP-dependent enzyme, partial [Puia sp.]|nr:aminotransferase class V-fold PLP-dependent enzyme [Puia sp.]